MSPTQRTLGYLKKQGYKCGVVEKFNPFARRADGGSGIRIDLFGIIDIIALTPERTIGVQSTGQSFAAHHRKLTEEKFEECVDWLSCPARELWLIGWRQLKKKRGGKAMVWKPRIKVYTLDDFNPLV